MAVLLGAAAAPARAASDKPLIAVVPFSGPQAQRAEAVVVRTLRKKALLVPSSKWSASQRKLFAPSNSPDDIASVAEDVGAVVVVTGAVRREGRGWQLTVSVRDGKSGRSRDKLKYILRGPRVEARTLALLQSEVDKAFDHALEAADSDDDEPPMRKPKREPPPVARKPTTAVPVVEDDEEKPTKNSDDEQAPLGDKKVEIKKEAPGGKRPRWAPYFDITAGAGITGRSWDFQPSSLPKFSSGVVAGLRVDATIYPLAMLWDRARGVFATLGLGATLDKPFWPASKGPDGNRYNTQELRVEGGLRWRFVLYKPLPRPELTVLAGGGLHQFAIAKKQDDVTGMISDVGPPDVSYAFVSLGVAFRLHFAEWASIFAGFNYLVVTAAGPATAGDEYGPARTYGIRVGGGLDFFAYKGLKLGVSGFYERFQLLFLGSDPPPALPGMNNVAENAVDQYFGGMVVVGYVY